MVSKQHATAQNELQESVNYYHGITVVLHNNIYEDEFSQEKQSGRKLAILAFTMKKTME